MISPHRHHPSVCCRSPIHTRSWSARAQHICEPLPSAALEEIPILVSPSFTLTSIVPLSVLASHIQVREEPLFTLGCWQTFANLEPAIESVLVTATRAMDALLTASPSQGFVASDTHPAAIASVVGSLPSEQSVSLPPLASGPLPVLAISLPIDRTPTVATCQIDTSMHATRARVHRPMRGH